MKNSCSEFHEQLGKEEAVLENADLKGAYKQTNIYRKSHFEREF